MIEPGMCGGGGSYKGKSWMFHIIFVSEIVPQVLVLWH